jgi:hypothetical protein
LKEYRGSSHFRRQRAARSKRVEAFGFELHGADPKFGYSSGQALRMCLAEGGLVACDPVWAEVTSFFPSTRDAGEAMGRLGVALSPLTLEAALAAGAAWKAHRSRGGRRARVVADFLIGSHALAVADRLLTRDRRFYRSYFRRLRILEPS